jgi:hypothetical protein
MMSSWATLLCPTKEVRHSLIQGIHVVYVTYLFVI